MRSIFFVPCKQRSTDALCKWRFSIANFAFTLPVFVLLRFFFFLFFSPLEKMAQCINEFIQESRQTFTMAEEEGERKGARGCESRPKSSLKRKGSLEKTNTCLDELLKHINVNGWQFLIKRSDWRHQTVSEAEAYAFCFTWV